MRRAPILGLVVATGLVSIGWNPLSYSPTVAPVRWSTASPVVWNPDGGSLGALSSTDAAARCVEAFTKWQDVPTATIAFAQGVQIRNGSNVAVDVTSANYALIINLDNGQNPIVFDNNRDIYNAIGMPGSVLGFAGVLRTSGTAITKAYAVLQGDWIDGDAGDGREVTVPVYVGVMVHEFGHFLGLGHTSVNLGPLQDGGLGACPPPTLGQFETMMPLAHNDMASLHHDDEVGVSALYPTAGFTSGLSRIAGRVLGKDGATPFDGANVILRRDTADCALLYGDAQATQSGVDPAETGGAGTFRFSGLTPGAAYTVRIATLDEGGSYPISDGTGSPPALRGPDEYFNGADEASFDPPDLPGVSSPIVAGAGGTTVSGIEVKINNPGFPGAIPTSGADALHVGKLDGATGLPPRSVALDDGGWDGAFGVSGTNRMAWVSRFTPDAQAYPFRLERIDMLFVDASTSPGRAIQLLVYTDPTGSGNPAAATLVRTQDATIQLLSGQTFNQYPLTSPVTVTSGDLYVGAIDLVADSGGTNFLGVLDTRPSGRAFYQINGASPGGYLACNSPAGCDDWTWMIRLSGSTVPPAGSLELSWGDPCNATAVPSQDAVVYQGSLGSLRTAPDHAPIACGTGGARRWILPGASAPGNVFWLVAPLLADREGTLGAGTGGGDRTPDGTCATIETGACP